MTHNITFSITSVHIRNSRKEIDSMKDIYNLKFFNGEYDNRAVEIFKENIQHGVLAIYSINAALESLVAILADELKIEETKFYYIVKSLIEDKKIITDIESYKKCIELRKCRNMITHWDKNYSTVL